MNFNISKLGILYFLLGIIFIPTVVCGAEAMPGSGYDSKSKTLKKSPLKEIKYCWGNALSGINLNLTMHSDDETKNILVEGGASIGWPLLGAEITGQLKTSYANKRKYFSWELKCQSSQSVRVNAFSRCDELGTGRVFWDRTKFREKYGDSLVWSLNRGGRLRLIIIASHALDLESTDSNLSAFINTLFIKSKVGEVNSHSHYYDNKLTFSIYFMQDGGSEEAKQEFIKRCRLENLDTMESCLNIISTVCKYAAGTGEEDFPEQIKRFPAVWDEEYISYGDKGRIAFLWNISNAK